MATTRSKMLGGMAVLALTLTGCGLGGDNTSNVEVEAGSVDPEALDGVELTVGSKDFDEQLVLGQLSILMLDAAGATVNDRTNIQGTTATRNALLSGGIDMYWGYTGTAWITFLGHDEPIPDAEKQYQAVKKEDLAKNDVVWGEPAPFNNTYALATTEEFAQENNLESLTDATDNINSNPDVTTCVESEFASRPDGMPGLTKAYGMDVSPSSIKKLGTGVVYTQTDNGTCDFGEVFTTDGRIAALGLKPLEDDKAFFPLYNGAVEVMKQTNEQHPEILEVLAPLAEILTTEQMAELNAQVSSEGLPPEQVARDFLTEEGFIQ